MKKQAAEQKAAEVFGGEEEEYAAEGTEPSVVVPVFGFDKLCV